jgi:hypothetical protein
MMQLVLQLADKTNFIFLGSLFRPAIDNYDLPVAVMRQ